MTVTFMGYAETSAILRRKFNGGLITPTEFQQARLLLQTEVLLNPGFDLLTITIETFWTAWQSRIGIISIRQMPRCWRRISAALRPDLLLAF